MSKEIFRNNLKNYLINRYGSKNIDRLIDGTHTLLVSSKMFNLYFRVSLPKGRKHRIWDYETLVIARINFKEQRVGNATSLLQFLVTQSKLLKFKKIGLEMTNNSASNFAKKHGFSQINEKNWVISIEDLKVEHNGKD